MTRPGTDSPGTTRPIAVVSAGLRSPSTTRLLADDLAQQVAAAIGPEAEVELIEVRDHAHALADAMLTGFATGALKDALAGVADAEGLVVLTPTFSGSYAGLFKLFFDVLDPGALRDKPVLLAATGGTERHSLMLEHAMRPLFSYLGALPVRTAVYAATADFGGAGVGALQARIARAADEFAAAVVRQRPANADGGPAAAPEVADFADLLRGLEQ